MRNLPKEIPSEWPVYRIIRFYQGGRPRTIKNGVTRQEAQEHCKSEKTHGPGWFDGFDLMKGYRQTNE